VQKAVIKIISKRSRDGKRFVDISTRDLGLGELAFQINK